MTRNRNYVTMEEIFRERGIQDKRIVAIVPNYQEDPTVVKHTIERVAEANEYAARNGSSFILSEIILSDQSGGEVAKVNRGNMYTSRDVVKRLYGEFVPEIYHLTFDKMMEEILWDYLDGIEDYEPHLKREPPRGKGWNMFLSSLATGIQADDSVVLVFLDADNKQIGPDYPVGLGIRLAEKGSKFKFAKAAFVRYHMEGNERHLGGRINASVGVPIADMLAEKGLMPKLYYPLSGEIGILRSLWWSIKIPVRYGVEMGTNLQVLSKLSDLEGLPISTDEFYQVDLKLNMDQPLAEGEPKEVVLGKASEMTKQIILTTLGVLRKNIKEKWKTYEEFMSDFVKRQEINLKRWSREGIPITGGLALEELKEITRNVVSEEVEKFYSGRLSRDEIESEFLMPVYDLKEQLGEVDFKHFVRDVTTKKVEIR